MKYYHGSSGDSFADATLHDTDRCDRLEEPSRPLADSSVEALEDPDLCPECHGDAAADAEDGDGGDSEGSDTCMVEKSDGELCGRDRPCPYHDKR